MDSFNIVFTGQDAVETRVESVPPLQPHQILVETSRSLISTGTEGIVLGRKFAPGTHWDNWAKYPFYPGYLAAGKVARVGENVTRWKVGDRIAARAHHCRFNVRDGGDTRMERIPDGVSDEAAAWFGLAHIVQTGVRTAQHEMGDAVVVIGVGLLGQLVVQYARVLGAREIIAIDTSQMRLDMAKAHGATHVLQMGTEQARDKVWEITKERGADVVYDVTGFADVLPRALGLARDFGKVIVLGDTGTPGDQRLTSDIIVRGVRILGAHDSHLPNRSSKRDFWSHETMTQLFFTYLQRGQMEVDSLVTHRYAPQDAVETYRMLQSPERATAMGVIFDWSKLNR